MRTEYRLGLDLGANSLGWVIYDLNRQMRPVAIRRIGTHIFPDGLDNQGDKSKAEERRLPRQQRRRRDRTIMRKDLLMQVLIKVGLFPEDGGERKDLAVLDPYELRSRGLDQRLELFSFGRALFHLGQRRGFKSNRKAEHGKNAKADEKKAGNMKEAARALEQQLGPDKKRGFRTYGDYLYVHYREGRSPRGKGEQQIQPVRIRPHSVKGRNEYDIYPSRKMYEDEFEALWSAQQQFHEGDNRPFPGADHKARLRHLLFHQRPLKAVAPGICTFFNGSEGMPREDRTYTALPIAAQARMLQDLANLRWESRDGQETGKLTIAQRDLLFGQLRSKTKLSFDQMRKILKLAEGALFNFERGINGRKEFKGCEVSAKLSKYFGKARWENMSETEQTEIVLTLIDEEDEAVLLDLAKNKWHLPDEPARELVQYNPPEKRARLSLKALRQLVPVLRESHGTAGAEDPIPYHEAVIASGLGHHSDFRTGEIHAELPYYGAILSRYMAPVRSSSATEEEHLHGKIANPTVHIGLNRLRKIINAIMKKYGPPAEIIIEIARDLKRSKDEKDALQKEQKKNREFREECERDLRTIFPDLSKAPKNALLVMKLWKELGKDPLKRLCPYTGEPIGITRLFNGDVEIEHILPERLTFDSSPANLTLAIRRANRDKGRRTPFEAFGHNPPGYRWEEILDRVSYLPANKKWRFKPDALELLRSKARRALAKMEGDLPPTLLKEIEEAGEFLARHLVDTQYLSRVARQYLTAICDPNRVWAVPGQLTAKLRADWSLNSILSSSNQKTRNDHRHHAIDAAVIGLTDRSTLQRISNLDRAGRSEIQFDDPWTNFREELRDKVNKIIVSHKPEHGIDYRRLADNRNTTGKLHEETAYGLIKKDSDAYRDGYRLVFRKPLASLTASEIERIRDPLLRAALQETVAPFLEKGKLNDKNKEAYTAALAAFGQEHGIKRVRLMSKEEGAIPIKAKGNMPYKALVGGDNHHLDIFAKPGGKWQFEGESVFSVNQPGWKPRWQIEHPETTLVMRLHKGDLIEINQDMGRVICRIYQLRFKSSYLFLAPHQETGKLQERHEDTDDPFRWIMMNFKDLEKQRARKVLVNYLGIVHRI